MADNVRNVSGSFTTICEEGIAERKGMFVLSAVTATCPEPQEPGATRWVQLMSIFETSDKSVGILCRTSSDRGKTWREQGILDQPYRLSSKEDITMRKVQNGCIYDETAGALVRYVTEMLWKEGNKAALLDSIFRNRRIYYSLSYDGGETWSDPIYIYQKGSDYDRDRMFPGVQFGRNMIMTTIPIIIRGDGPNRGKIAIGVQIQEVDAAGELVNPTGMGYFKSGSLLGAWNPEHGQYEWEISHIHAEVTPEESTRGVCEPSICELDDGRLVMILRGSNAKASERMIGTKWISVSSDQGFTWSRPERLLYDDGSVMFSSSTYPLLVRNEGGRLFYIGIINEENPDGNLPRYPLCIARFDPDTLSIVKNSVSVLDTKRPHHDKTSGPYYVDYSNQTVLIDEIEQKIIVYAPYRADLNRFESVLNQYTISENPI